MRGRGSEEAFTTSDKAEAEKRARALSMDMEWLADGANRARPAQAHARVPSRSQGEEDVVQHDGGDARQGAQLGHVHRWVLDPRGHRAARLSRRRASSSGGRRVTCSSSTTLPRTTADAPCCRPSGSSSPPASETTKSLYILHVASGDSLPMGSFGSMDRQPGGGIHQRGSSLCTHASRGRCSRGGWRDRLAFGSLSKESTPQLCDDLKIQKMLPKLKHCFKI
jgi:hypothetical protein